MYEPNANGSRRKSDELLLWEDEAALVVRGWVPPAKTPLRVEITLVVPANKLWTFDAGNYEKPITDAVVGKRRDQWVADTRIVKRAAEGYELPHVTVIVLPLATSGEEGVSDARD
jgi:hypothetical protein